MHEKRKIIFKSHDKIVKQTTIGQICKYSIVIQVTPVQVLFYRRVGDFKLATFA